ncbi:F0F1 ATP synthase subunit A [Nannocystis pusilla]|uniref:ATP synthase subunit a n=3 Tax=Nannocystis pusilla TaxID=889268 RepID=A0A9X3EUV9_9BACT|nr:F0F1 ATP synthase subunit A [Nannocystis pusilla]MCY1010597.1 F0F1 ATP synthase subunit A [Nannocystis pusilla]
MGDHDSWYTLLMPEFWAHLESSAAEHLARDKAFLIFGATHFTLVHVAGALLAFVVLIIAALRYRASLQDSSRGVIPPRNFGLAAMVDGFVGAVYNLSADVMGEEDAKRFLPLTGSLALFIFVCNIQGLIPGMLPPTDTLKTNLVFALIVFIVYNVAGVVRNGFGYLAHFLGPKIGGFPWLFFLFLPIEIVSHLARPVSLSLRLTGNIVADHKVVGVVALMVPLLVPLPFLLLGTVVAIVQTLVFTLLTIIFIGLAVEHAEEH